jgi:hypothetical protein
MTFDRAYLIRDAIVGKPTDAEKAAAVAALGELLARLKTCEGEASPHD